MNTTRIFALAAAGLITALLFAAIANGMPVKQTTGNNTIGSLHDERATLP
jgi:hypothetical protein